jgi:proline dehydrogenase
VMRVSNALRGPILAASRNPALRAFAVRHGMRFGAARFVAGTTLDDFVAVARAQNVLGRRVAAGYLGEGVTEAADADRIASDFVEIVDRIRAERLDATVAVKLSHLGLDVAEERALANVRAVVAHAAGTGTFVRIDMEESRRVPATLRIYRALRGAGYDNVGLVLQAALRRSAADLDELGTIGANVRLVKGAYREPAAVAYTSRADIDRNYAALIERALSTLPFTAVATHDGAIVEGTIAAARGQAAAGRFEFQTLLGVRTELVAELVRRGYPVRVSVPFGADWYPYLMRRMAENPANLALILRNWRFSERPG